MNSRLEKKHRWEFPINMKITLMLACPIQIRAIKRGCGHTLHLGDLALSVEIVIEMTDRLHTSEKSHRIPMTRRNIIWCSYEK